MTHETKEELGPGLAEKEISAYNNSINQARGSWTCEGSSRAGYAECYVMKKGANGAKQV